jgi:hypothetical protein
MDQGMDHELAPDETRHDEPRVKRGRKFATALLIGPFVLYMFCASTRSGVIDCSPLDPTTAEELMNSIFDMGDTPPSRTQIPLQTSGQPIFFMSISSKVSSEVIHFVKNDHSLFFFYIIYIISDFY